jgi:predicted Zn-dependent protease
MKKKEATPRYSVEDGRKAAVEATNQEQMRAAINMIASAIRGAWYELRTEERVQEVARSLAGHAIGLDMHDVVISMRRGRDLVMESVPCGRVVETSE